MKFVVILFFITFFCQSVLYGSSVIFVDQISITYYISILHFKVDFVDMKHASINEWLSVFICMFEFVVVI